MTILAALVGPVFAMSPAPPDRAALESALQGEGALVVEGRALSRAQLRTIYQRRGFEPIWNDERAESFRRTLDDALSQGLDAADFAARAASPVARELAQTDAFMRYAAALARGRVAPGSFESDWFISRPNFDPEKALDAALAAGVEKALANLSPHDPAYERLRIAFARYRALAKPGWQVLSATATMRRGTSGATVRALRERLAAEGFAALTQGDADSEVYDDALAIVVSRFQETHGLAVDGVTGRATIAALNVSAAARADQISLNLERWRSLPRMSDPTRIEVNAAAASAVLYEDGAPLKTMRVIVGTVTHPTPVFRAMMTSVLINPPWNVPASIVRNEINPRLKRDPGFLARGNYVYREVGGGRRLVQLPGPKNALGQLKFEMPNPQDVYMHDTPNRRLFALPRRTLSHGCVRVEDPRDLARRVIDSEAWPDAAIDEAIATGQTQRVALKQEIPVYVLYWTAFVDSDDTVEFRDDVYGRDRRLAEALAAEAAGHPAAAATDRGAC